MELLDPLRCSHSNADVSAMRPNARASRHALSTSNVPRYPVEQKLHDMLVLELQGAMPPDELSRLMKEGEVLTTRSPCAWH